MKKILLIAITGLLTVGFVATSCKKDDPTIYTVTFNSQNGSAVASQSVEDGQKAKKPTDPTRENYTFGGWALDAQGTQPWDFDKDVVVKNTTLYAQWASEDDMRGQLQTAVTMSAAYKETDYTSASWAPFATALTEAQGVLADQNADAAAIETALENLLNAADDLVPVSGAQTSKDALQAAITVAEQFNSNAYTSNSWAPFAAALKTAEEVDADPNATQRQITDALNALNDAIDGLVQDNANSTVANKTTLNARITYADGLVEADYTASSWANFETALAQAKATAANAGATQAQVDASVVSLNNAIAALDHVVINDPNSDPSADKSALESFIADAQALNEADYTPDSWAVFQSALNEAVSVDGNADATQAQVDQAYNTLQAATDDLVKNQDSGLVRDLTNQLTSLVNSLPSASLINSNPLLAATTIPVAELADGVRDQLNALLGGVDNTVIDGLNTQLDGVLGALGLTNLI